MQTYLSSEELKEKAKENLTGHYGLLIGSSLFSGLISTAVLLVLSLFLSASPPSFISALLAEGVAFIVSVFAGVFTVGITLMYMKYMSGAQATFSDLFYGFSHNFQTALTVSLVMNGLSFVLEMSYSIPNYLYLYTGDMIFYYVAFPCLAAGLLICVPIYLMLSQSYFLLLDFPNESAGKVLSTSIRITKGHRARLFYLTVTFLPLLLLGIISLIGVLWIIPYMNMTLAAFYFDLMKPKKVQGTV